MMIDIFDFVKEHWAEIFVGILVAFIVLIFVALIVGTVTNENNRINEGTITEKSYEPAFTTTEYIKSGDITIPNNRYYPESYYFTISGDKDGKIVEYYFAVTKEEYDNYKIGDYYKR